MTASTTVTDPLDDSNRTIHRTNAVTPSSVASPLRAPFTRFSCVSGPLA